MDGHDRERIWIRRDDEAVRRQKQILIYRTEAWVQVNKGVIDAMLFLDQLNQTIQGPR